MTEEHTIYPIDLLDLPTRARNTLVEAGLTTPGDLRRRSNEDLLALHGFGPVSLKQVKKRLALWEQEHQSEEETDEAHEAERDPFPLLPGRRVLHAAWLPGESGRLFLWGEGELVSSPASQRHPFHVSPAVLRDVLPDLIPEAAEETAGLAHLPILDFIARTLSV